MASGQASFVTPTSVLMPVASVVLSPPRHADSDAATSAITNSFRTMKPLCSVREWPGLPVGADADPDTEQSPWLKYQEGYDEHAVENRLHLEDVRQLGR